MFLDDPQTVASILGKLLRGGDKTDVLVAYQVAFDLFENENRKFLLSVRDRLPETSNSAQQLVSNSVNNAAAAPPPPPSAHVIIMPGGSEHGATAIEAEMIRTEEEAPKQDSHRGKGLAAVNRSTYAQRLKKIKGIFSGDTPINLTLQFLCTHNRCYSQQLLAVWVLLHPPQSFHTINRQCSRNLDLFHVFCNPLKLLSS
jgi:26S proteasome regulatory subunit N2